MNKLIAGALGNKTELDLGVEVSMPLTFKMADVKKLSSRSGAYSKTIKLPGTRINNAFFGGLYDPNADFTQFNPNIRTPVILTVEDKEMLNGFMQLKNIDVDSLGYITYNVVLYDSTVNFMTDIGSLLVVGNSKTLLEQANNTKSVNDIKFNDEPTATPAIVKDTQINLNHTYQYGNLVNSWSGAAAQWNTKGYYYPLLYTTKPIMDIIDFQPATYHKTILDGIVKHHGYTWSGSLKDSLKYEREVIPYTGGKPKESELLSSARTFKAGKTVNSFVFDYTPPDPTNYWGYITSTGAVDLPIITGSDYTDINNVWNEVNVYTAPSVGKYYFEADIKSLTNINASRATFGVIIGNPLKHNLDILLKAEVYNELGVLQYTTEGVNMGQTEIIIDNPLQGTTQNFFDFVETNSAYQVQVLSPSIYQPYFDLQTGWQVKFLINSESEGLKKDNGGDYTGSTIDVNNLYVQSFNGSFIKCVNVRGDLKEWQEIDYSNFIPKKLKQSDIISDLIARYNCFIYPNPLNDNDIIFDIGEEFYSSGSVVDWSNKKDNNERDKITMLGELQSAKALLTYTKGTDAHNVDYFNASGEIYGQYEYDFDNDFATGTNTIQSPFEPTPLILQGNGDPAIVSALSPNSTTAKYRVLYAGEDLINPGTITPDKYFTLKYLATSSSATYTQVERFTYPYAGSYNYPLDINLVSSTSWKPSTWESINFGQLAFLNTDLGTSQPSVTLESLYWKTNLNQISKGKLFTSKYNLSASDLDFIRLNPNAKVWVNNKYWRVNVVSVEANDNIRRLTKVELVSIE